MSFGFALVLGIGLLLVSGLWVFARRFERTAGRDAERLVDEAEQALSAFEMRTAADSVIKHRHRDGRHRRRRRRKKSSGSESQ